MSTGRMTDRPSARVWLLAAVELIGALVLARLIVWTDRPSGAGQDHAMPGMTGASSHTLQWSWPVYAAGAVAVAAVGWWWFRRHAVAALIGAAAALLLVASQPLRVLASQSHLVAMVVLEVLMVLIPLAVVTVLPYPARTGAGWFALVAGSAVAYAAVLIIVHLPAVHHRGAELGAAPMWTVLVTTPVGIAYWFGVLRTAAVMPVKTRRAALLGAQEVAAFIGLLSLFGAWGDMAHPNPLGIPTAWDQGLGGLVMMATCAAVAIPMAKSLR